MLSPEKYLKTLLRESKLCSRSCEDLLRRQTQTSILNQPEKRVKMNDVITNIDDIEVNSQEVV